MAAGGSVISGHLDWSDTFGPAAGSDVGRANQASQHLKLATGGAGKTIRLNSKTSTDDANDVIGFQTKPRMGVASTHTVTGFEASPGVNDGYAVANVKGAHIDAYLKGTTGNISGDVRGIELELVTDDGGTRTIGGNVSFMRLRAAFSGTITGKFAAFRVEKPETQTNSNDLDCLFQLTGASAAWPSSGSCSNAAGAILVEVDGGTVYIPLFTTLS